MYIVFKWVHVRGCVQCMRVGVYSVCVLVSIVVCTHAAIAACWARRSASARRGTAAAPPASATL